MDEHDMLGTECDISDSPPPPDNPIHSSISPPKSRKRAQRNPGEKVVLRLDDYNRPVSPKDDVVDLSRHAGKLARREIPLIYNDFRDVPPEPYERVIKGLNEHYVFENFEENGVDCEYIREKVKDAWKGFKSKLKRNRVDGKDPAVVKLENAPKGHPIEDWRMFIDNCNTEEMQKRSAQNSDNRAGCKFPNCSGRIPAQVVRHKIAKEKGVPDSQVGLGRVYREMHTKKKDKALQNPEDDDGGDYNIEDDGDFSPGRLNAIGAGVSKTLVKKMIPIVKRHENEEVNSKMWKNKMEGKIDGLATVVSKFIKSVDANRSQSPSVQLSGNPYDGSATSMYTQKPSMRPPGKDHVVGVSPLNNTRRASLPPSVPRGDVDVSLTMPISPSGHPDGDSSQKLTTQRTSMPSSGHSHDVNASMRKPMPLSGHHLGGDSFTPNKRKFVSPGGHRSDGLSQVNKAKTTSMSPSGHSYNHGSSVTKSVPLSGYSRNEDSSPKSNTGKTTMPSSEHRYDGSSLVNSTKKIGIPPTVDHYQTSTFAKTPKTSMLLSGHCHDGGSSSGKNSIQMPPIVSKEHHHEVNASLVNNSKRAVMFPSGKDLDDMIISKGLPKISTGDARDLIGTKVKVRGGWPSKVLALGAIKAVHPLEEFEGRKLGFGNFLISVDSVMCPAFQLPYPQGGKTTLGQVEGGLVIWPRDDIKLMGIS